MKKLLSFWLLLIVACAPSARSSRGPASDAASQVSPFDMSVIRPGDARDEILTDAFDLLAKSMIDSCSACAREFRRHAFERLEERFPPGLVVRSDSTSRFLRADEAQNELRLTSPPEGAPRLSFRFHTAADRLVGIADSDMTDEGLADWCRSTPAGTAFGGELEIIPFAYGDGPTFLYHASSNTIELQCRVLAVAGDEPAR
ncbi:MAG: hypothetical protein ACKVU1_00730 [bacterium]